MSEFTALMKSLGVINETLGEIRDRFLPEYQPIIPADLDPDRETMISDPRPGVCGYRIVTAKGDTETHARLHDALRFALSQPGPWCLQELHEVEGAPRAWRSFDTPATNLLVHARVIENLIDTMDREGYASTSDIANEAWRRLRRLVGRDASIEVIS